MLAISTVGTDTGYNSGTGAVTTGMTVTLPGGLAVGDVIFVGMDTAVVTTTPPAAFTQLVLSSSNVNGGIWYRIVDGTESSTYNWSTSSSTKYAGFIACRRGVDTSVITDVTIGTNSQTTAGTTATWNSVTTVTDGCQIMLVSLAINGSANVTGNSFTTVSGYTETIDTWSTQGSTGIIGNNGVALDTLTQTTHGATSSQSSTSAKSSKFVNYTIALKPRIDATITGVVAAATTAAPAGTVTATNTLPTRRGFTSAVGGATTVGALPTGTVQNDVSYVALTTNGTVTTPSGWTLLAGPVAVGTIDGYLFRRVEGPSPSGQTFTSTGSSTLLWASYYNVDTTTPEDVAVTYPSTASGTSFSNSGITTVAANSMILGGLWTTPPVGGTTITPPGVLTDTTTAGSSDEVEIADGLIKTSGGSATGTLTWTVGSSVAGGVPFLLALRQSGASSGATVSGAVSATTTAAPAGSVSVTSTATIAGAVSAVTTAAPAGTVTATSNVTIAGVVAAVATAAPAGTVSVTSNATIAGVVSGTTTAAPAGSVSVTSTATISGAVSAVTTGAPAGSVTAVKNVTISGVVSATTTAASAGTVSGTATVTGAVSAVTTTAPAGSVATAGNVTVSGVVATTTTAAPTGTITGNANVTGVISATTTGAPAGGLTKTVNGTVSATTTGAPAGSVSVGVTITGVVAGTTTAAAPGTITGTANIPGATAAVTVATPAGAVDTAGNVSAVGPASTVTTGAPAGTVTTTSSVTISGAVAGTAIAAPAGSVLAVAHVTVTGVSAGVTVSATSGLVQIFLATHGLTLKSETIPKATASGSKPSGYSGSYIGVVKRRNYGTKLRPVSTGTKGHTVNSGGSQRRVHVTGTQGRPISGG